MAISFAQHGSRRGPLWVWWSHRRLVAGWGIFHPSFGRPIPRMCALHTYSQPATASIRPNRWTAPCGRVRLEGCTAAMVGDCKPTLTCLPAAGLPSGHAGARSGRCHCLSSAFPVWTVKVDGVSSHCRQARLQSTSIHDGLHGTEAPSRLKVLPTLRLSCIHKHRRGNGTPLQCRGVAACQKRATRV